MMLPGGSPEATPHSRRPRRFHPCVW